jgi:non-specific serine/threonine protein kinase
MTAQERISTRPPLPMIPPDAFLGRASDLEAVRSLLLEGTARLLTIVGPGGVGKTRLALEFAHTARSAFADGIWFVDLSEVREAARVPGAIARALGIRGQELHAREAVTAFLRYSESLLVLDNLEQVAGVGLEVARLLSDAAALRIIGTSRQPLLVRGEQRYPLQPLGLPVAGSDLETIGRAPAVTLFVQRAQEVRSDFRLTPQNLEAVWRLCGALDGLPLALELAAAHMNTFPPAAVLNYWLEHHGLPDARTQDRPLRQRSLRAVTDWSYALLSRTERSLFRQLGVFAGDFGIDAVEVVAAEHVTDGLEALAGLADQHLIVPKHAGMELRFSLPGTLRAFALEELRETGQLDAVQARHAVFYTALAEEAAAHLHDPEGQVWAERLDRESLNLRAALQWCFGGGDTRLGARLCAALGSYWAIRGAFTEGRDWFEQALEHSPRPTAFRARLLVSAEHLAVSAGDVERGAILAEEAATILLFSDNPTECAAGLTSLARAAWFRGAFDRAAQIFERALEVDRTPLEGASRVSALISLASIHRKQGAPERALALLNEALRIARAQGDRCATIPILCNLGWLSAHLGQQARAVRLLLEGLTLASAWGDAPHIALFLEHLGMVAAEQGLHELAVILCVSSATHGERVPATHGERVPAMNGERAPSTHDEASPLRLEPQRNAEREARLDELHAQICPEAFQAASEQGTRLSPAEIGQVCFSAFTNAWMNPAPTEPTEIVELSPRELEVLHGVAAGENTKKIAIMLGVSASTVRFHVESIFRKLVCHTRAEAVRVAVEHGLLGSIESRDSLLNK